MRTAFATALLAIGIASVVGQALALTDDFGGPGVDPLKWDTENTGGLSGSIVGGKLVVSGAYDSEHTIPGTGGWNGYFLVSKENFAGQVEASVEFSIDAAAGSEYQVSLSLNGAAGQVNPATDSLFWQAYYLAGSQNSVGFLTRFLGGTPYRAVLDPADIVVGTPHVYRVVRKATGEASFYLDGNLKGTTAFVTGDLKVVLHVGLHGAGTSISASFDNLVAQDARLPLARLEASQDRIDAGDVVTLDGSTSEYAGGTINGFFFDFGDGQTSGWTASSFVTHVFASSGVYAARLRVNSTDGKQSEWAIQSIYVDAWPPSAVLTATPTRTATFEQVGFSGADSNDLDGSVVAYRFDFGDGVDSGWVPSAGATHQYVLDGAYSARLKVRDDDGLESQWSSAVRVDVANRPPTASLLASADSVELGTSVSFDAAGSADLDGGIAAYYFDFGDGVNSGWRDGPSIAHLYTTTGRYNVTLLVRDNKGVVSEDPAWSVVEVREVGLFSPRGPYVYLMVALVVGTGIAAYVVLKRRSRRDKEEADKGVPPPN